MSDREIRSAVLDLLDEAPAAPDLDLRLTGESPRRRIRPVVAVAAVALGVVLLIGVPVWWLAGRSTSSPASSEITSDWAKAPDPPFGPRMRVFASPLSDGRVLVWGGIDNVPDGAYHRLPTDGGIYDPVTGQWDTIPPAPVALIDEFSATQLVQNRLMVLASSSADPVTLVGAVYDIETGTWTEVPAVPSIRRYVDAVGWDGQTLAVIRVDPGVEDGAVATPVTMRWSLDTGEWTEGAPAPLELRFAAGAAFDSTRIAIWGGTTFNPRALDIPERPESNDEFDDAVRAGSLFDGAIYDVTADEWEMVPEAPVSVVSPQLAWVDGDLVISGRGPDGLSPVAAAYDVAADRWGSFPLAPAGYPPFEREPSRWFYSDTMQSILSVGSLVVQSGPQPTEWYDPDTDRWFSAPTYDLHRDSSLVVATTATHDNPDDVPFRASIFTDGEWTQLDPAPFANRMEPGVAVIEDLVIVSGGAQGPSLELTADTWVLKLHEPDESDATAASPYERVTTDLILSDGVVTNQEYTAGAHAVAACLAEKGVGVEVDYDDDGQAFFVGLDARTASTEEMHARSELFDACVRAHFGKGVQLTRLAQIGAFDLQAYAVWMAATIRCVESVTGSEFGELTFDAHGLPTSEAEEIWREAIEANSGTPYHQCLQQHEPPGVAGDAGEHEGGDVVYGFDLFPTLGDK